MHQGPPQNAYQRPPPAARHHSWLLLLVLAGAAFAILGGAGYMVWTAPSRGGMQLSSYLCPGGSGALGAVLLRWPKGGAGVASGTYREAKITGTAPDEQLSTWGGAFSGHVSRSGVSFDLGGGVQLRGKPAASLLTLDMRQRDGTIQPVACKKAGMAEWNGAVADLKAAVSKDNRQAAQQQQLAARERAARQAQEAARKAQEATPVQTRLAHDIATLWRDASALDHDTSLGNDIQAMKNELATEQGDLAAERHSSCNDGKAADDAGTVNGDLGTVQRRVSVLKANSVPGDLTAVRNDVRTLQNLGAAPGAGPSAAIAAGQQSLSNLVGAISWAQQEGQALNHQAQQIAAQESRLPNSGCRPSGGTPSRSPGRAPSSSPRGTPSPSASPEAHDDS